MKTLINKLIIIGCIFLAVNTNAYAQSQAQAVGAISSSYQVATGGLVNLTTWGGIGTSFTVTGNNVYHDGADVDEGAYSLGKIPSGTAFIIQFTAPDTEDGFRVGLGPGASLPTGDNDLTISIFSSFSGPYGKFIGHDSGGSFYGEDADYVVGTKIAKIVGDGSQMTFWVSTDGAVSFHRLQVSGVDVPPFTQAAVDYYVKIWADTLPTQILNIQTTPLH